MTVAPWCGAQDAPVDKAGTISASARLVNLPVVVRDNKGKLVSNLGKEDFALTVDGKPGVLRYFDKDQNVRLTLCGAAGSIRASRSARCWTRNAWRVGRFLKICSARPARMAQTARLSSSLRMRQSYLPT